MKTRDLTKVSICVALLCISAYISIPLPFTTAMLTAQTLIINLLALVLTPKQSFTAVSVYILLGTFGLPIFSGGASSLGKLFGPTGGFILAFLVAVPIISFLKGKANSFLRYNIVTILVGMPIIYIGGTISMCLVQQIDVYSALTMAVIPFISGDIIKCVAASFLGVRLNCLLPNAVNA